MTTKFDINIEEIEKNETNGLEYSSLTLKFSGKNVNEVLTNTLRRVMLNNIPTYAFPSECISIEENTSIFNNDQMRIRLTQLPIFKTPLDLSYLPEKYWYDVDYTSSTRPKHPSEKNIEIYIPSVNSNENIKCITTNDIQYYEDGKLNKNKYNKEFPILLIKLRPSESFKCRMKAVLGTGERNAIWSGAGNAYHNIVNSSDGNSIDHILLHIESCGQFDEYELVYKACGFMQEKLLETKEKIYENYTSESSKDEPLKIVNITLDNESHTIGGIITYVLQERDDVEYAGIGKMNELVKQITLSIRYKKETKNPLEPIMQSIDYVIKMMEFMQAKVYKLGKKFINVQTK